MYLQVILSFIATLLDSGTFTHMLLFLEFFFEIAFKDSFLAMCEYLLQSHIDILSWSKYVLSLSFTFTCLAQSQDPLPL